MTPQQTQAKIKRLQAQHIKQRERVSVVESKANDLANKIRELGGDPWEHVGDGPHW